MLLQIEKLRNALTHLRYEGRAQRAKNIKAVSESVRRLDVCLLHHRNLQERVVFPFLQTHIPRHEPAIHFLEVDHQDIEINKEKIERNIQKLTGAENDIDSGKIYELGIYLISQLQHHIGFEQKHFHHSLRKELREDEKKEMRRRISAWLKRKASRRLKAGKERDDHE